jgi:hypothetical protein
MLRKASVRSHPMLFRVCHPHPSPTAAAPLQCACLILQQQVYGFKKNAKAK